MRTAVASPIAAGQIRAFKGAHPQMILDYHILDEPRAKNDSSSHYSTPAFPCRKRASSTPGLSDAG